VKRWLAIVGILCGCKTIEMGKYAPDPNHPPEVVADTGITDDPNAPIDCNEEPLVNWANFGQGLFIQACFGCHYSESPDRYGAPDDVVFDGVDDVWAQRAMVLFTSIGDSPSMPPNGGTNELERRMLEIWLTCAPEGT
jgi:hypothetical protein